MNVDIGPINEENFFFDGLNAVRNDDAQEHDHLDVQQINQL